MFILKWYSYIYNNVNYTFVTTLYFSDQSNDPFTVSRLAEAISGNNENQNGNDEWTQ